jgi:polar amino acid transport system substrate-binding protein
MKKTLGALILLALAGLVATPVFGADIELARKSTLETIMKNKVLRVGLEAGYMPFELRDKRGNIVGFDVDVATEMARAMGKDIKLELINTAWDGIIPALLTDKFDIIMSGMTVTQERNLQVNFAEPYITIGQTLIVNKKHAGKVKSYRDLNQKSMVVTSKLGTTGEQSVKRMIPNCSYKSFESEQEAVMEVVNGRADAFVYDLPYCVVFMAEQGTKSGKAFFLDKPFTFEPLGWAIRKGDPDFLNWLTNFLRQIQGDGTYDRIYTKWMKGTDWFKEAGNQ